MGSQPLFVPGRVPRRRGAAGPADQDAIVVRVSGRRYWYSAVAAAPVLLVIGVVGALAGAWDAMVGITIASMSTTLLPVMIVGLVFLTWRTRFSAAGIDCCFTWSRTRVPWPASRSLFIVEKRQRGRRTRWLITVSVIGSRGQVRLPAPRVYTSDLLVGVELIEEELDVIWRKALDRGWVREQDAPAAQPDPDALQAGPPGADYPASPPPRHADRGTPEASAHLDDAHRWAEMVAPDPELVAQEPLVLRAGSVERSIAGAARSALLIIIGAVTLSMGRLPTAGLWCLRSSHCVYESASYAAAVLLGVLLVMTGVLFACATLRDWAGTTVVARSGIHMYHLLSTRHVPWPASRSDIFTGFFSVWVLDRDRRAYGLPGIRFTDPDDDGIARLQYLHMAATIWAWGASRGLTHDDGRYRPAADASFERRRRLSARAAARMLRREGEAAPRARGPG